MSESKRILVLIDSWFPKLSGGPVHVWELSQELCKRYDYHITIVTRRLLGNDAFIPEVPPPLLKKLSVVLLGPRMSWGNMFARIWYLIQASVFGLTHRFDLIAVHAFSPCLVGRFLGFVKGSPVVMTVHGTRLLTRMSMGHGIADSFLRRLELFFLLKVRYDHTISVDKRFLALRNVSRTITVIPNGVHRYQGKVKRKIDHGLPLLFVGRLEVQKGLMILLQALTYVRKNCPAITLTIVGAGSQEQKLKDYVHSRQLEGAVRFVGEQAGSELASSYKAALVFVLPSLYEGHSLALLTAMSFGLCVIVTDVGANDEMVENNVTGILIKPNDPKVLAEAIEKLYVSKRIDMMGKNARAFVQAHFSWERAARETHRVYQEVLQR